jgi:hypothetical protein
VKDIASRFYRFLVCDESGGGYEWEFRKVAGKKHVHMYLILVDHYFGSFLLVEVDLYFGGFESSTGFWGFKLKVAIANKSSHRISNAEELKPTKSIVRKNLFSSLWRFCHFPVACIWRNSEDWGFRSPRKKFPETTSEFGG